MKYLKIFENLINDNYHKKIMQFSRDIQLYDVPSKLRVINGVDMFVVALEQLKEYFDGNIPIEEISHPDNTLRNIMQLWYLDKLKCNKRKPQTTSLGKINKLQYFDDGHLLDGEMKGYIVTVLDDYGKPIIKFKTKTGIKGKTTCIIEKDSKKVNVYYN